MKNRLTLRDKNLQLVYYKLVLKPILPYTTLYIFHRSHLCKFLLRRIIKITLIGFMDLSNRIWQH